MTEPYSTTALRALSTLLQVLRHFVIVARGNFAIHVGANLITPNLACLGEPAAYSGQ